MLELQDAYAGYGDGHALFGVSISVKPGEAVGILGRNGAGKSTTLKTIMGLVPRARGRLTFLDRDLAGMRTFEQKRAGGLLSGGEQQMLSIARTLMGNPRLLLLDEPSEGLAPLVIRLLRTQILRLKDEGITIMLCEQNLHFAMAICDRVYIIDTGQIGFAGSFEELESNPEVMRAHLTV